MNTRPARVPNIEPPERKAARLYRQEIRNEHRAFLESFDRQVAEIEARRLAVRKEPDDPGHR